MVLAFLRRKSSGVPEYQPLTDTLRLYAGWLLAWYFLIYAAGSYQFTRALPWKSDLLQQLFSSSLIAHSAFAAFLFLLATELHRLCSRKALIGLVLAVGAIVLFLLFTANA